MTSNRKQHPCRQDNKCRKSNQIDKICSKLQISVKSIQSDNPLSKSTKLKIQKFIQKDDVYGLQKYLTKKVINYDKQIGIKAMKWNILHFTIKNNSIKILKVMLPKIYQQQVSEYRHLVNSKTSQGYTSLMISIIYFSHDSLELLLNYGGFNLQLKDKREMTAYQIALNYKNQKAIPLLIAYEKNYKKYNDYINQQELSKPIPPLQSSLDFTQKVFQCFVDCFICFKPINQDQIDKNCNLPENLIMQKSFLAKSIQASKLKSILAQQKEEVQFDLVKIGNQQIQSKYQVQWKRLSTSVNQKNVLFDCFQPFDICEKNLILANNLIIFQSLSDHTWLVRKLIKTVKKVESTNTNSQNVLQFVIQTYLDGQLKKIIVDEYVPFLKQREQLMFLSNFNEMWPQLLQKGLAKIYGNYMKLSQIKPLTFIQNLAGYFTRRFELTEGINFLKSQHGQILKEKSIISALQEFSAKGYLTVLEGRQGTTLCPNNGSSSFKNYCYTVLNFYEKGSKRLILINCPYVLNSWKQKEKNQIMQLKLIKSHYNTHSQMCVWIDESQFAYFFKSVIVSFTQPNVSRTQLKMKYIIQRRCVSPKANPGNPSLLQIISNSLKNIISLGGSQTNIPKQSLYTKRLVFFKFTIQNNKNSQSFSLAMKDNQTHKFCKINSFKGWINGGFVDLTLQDTNTFQNDLIRIKHKKGDYLCMMELQILNLSINHNQDQSSQRSFFSSNHQQINQIPNQKQNLMKQSSKQQSKQSSKQQSQQKSKQKSKNQISKSQKHQLMLLCWSQDSIHMQHIEQQFAVLEWVQNWRKNTIKNWTFTQKRQLSNFKFITQKIGQRILILIQSSKNTDFILKIQKSQQLQTKIQNYVFEGVIQSTQKIENELKIKIQMIRDPEHFQYQYIVLGSHHNILKSIEEDNFEFVLTK